MLFATPHKILQAVPYSMIAVNLYLISAGGDKFFSSTPFVSIQHSYRKRVASILSKAVEKCRSGKNCLVYQKFHRHNTALNMPNFIETYLNIYLSLY